jgi:hypothetical protein
MVHTLLVHLNAQVLFEQTHVGLAMGLFAQSATHFEVAEQCTAQDFSLHENRHCELLQVQLLQIALQLLDPLHDTSQLPLSHPKPQVHPGDEQLQNESLQSCWQHLPMAHGPPHIPQPPPTPTNTPPWPATPPWPPWPPPPLPLVLLLAVLEAVEVAGPLRVPVSSSLQLAAMTTATKAEHTLRK